MPAINPLPTPPSRNDPANFSDRADAFLAALPAYTSEANALLDDVHTSRDTVQGLRNEVIAAGLENAAANAATATTKAAEAASSASEAFGYLQAYRATSYGALAADPVADPNGNPPTVGDEYFNTSMNLLKRFNGVTWQASDIATADLAAPGGSELVGAGDGAGGSLWTTVAGFISRIISNAGSAIVGYDGDTVQTVLDDAKPMANYTALRSYTGRATGVRITQTGLAGHFVRDASDTTSADNGGTIIVDASGRRWKRLFVGRVHAVWFGAKADWNGVAGTDNTGPIQAAIHYAATLSLVGPSVELPVGKLRITGNITTAGIGNVGQVGLVGAGKTATTLCPDGDFTAVNIVTSLIESGDFSVEWPVTAAASIPSARIGVELASGNYQFSNAVLKNVEVRYGYRGVIQNNWTAQPFGTMWMCTLYKVTANRCADWGFWLNSKVGSTTLRMVQCYVRGDSSAGGQYGKGVFANNFNDIQTDQLAIDQCLNEWVNFVNYNVCVMNGTAMEANKVSLTSARPVFLNGAQSVINGFKDISCTYDTGGNAQVIYAGSISTLSLSGYNEQYSTVGAGTTKYRAAFNAAAVQIAINDRTVLPTQVLDNGWFANVVYEGRRLSRVGQAPNYGSWLRGDNILNGAPAVGSPKGWVCTVAGSPGTWVSEGNL